MTAVLVIAPGPLDPANDAGVGTFAALAARHLAARGTRTIVLSPSSVCSAARFADVSYAEPVTPETIIEIARREEATAVLATFGGASGIAAAWRAFAEVDVLGTRVGARAPGPLVGARLDAPARDGESRCVIELLRDCDGTDVVVGVLLTGPDGPIADAVLRMPSLARGTPWSAQMNAVVALASETLRATFGDAYGLFSVTCAVPSRGFPRILEAFPGARFSSVAVARATNVPLAEIATEIALGSRLDEVSVRGVSLKTPPAWPEAIRKPVLAFARFPGARPSAGVGAVGQSLRVIDRRARPTSDAARDALVIIGAGPTDVDHVGERDAWAASAVLDARARGRSVVVIDDDPGSLAGALADRWLLQSSDAPVAPAELEGRDVFVLASPAPANGARAVEAAGGRVLDAPSTFFDDGTEPGEPDAGKLDVLMLGDGSATRLVATVEYVEPASVHVGDSAAFLPPQNTAVPILAALEDATRALLVRRKLRGLLTVTWSVGAAHSLLAVRFGPSPIVPFVERALGLDLARAAARLAHGEAIASLDLCEAVTPDFVAARETVFPRHLIAETSVGLGSTKRSIGEAMGIAPTMASAYKKALAGIGLPLANEHAASVAVLLAPAGADVIEAVAVARKLFPLGYRILATESAVSLLRDMRLPFDSATDEDARAALARGKVALALVTDVGRDERAASLRNRAIAAGVPCFTSTVLFRAACAAIEERVATDVRRAPRASR